jgi:hypothetical protein
VLRFAERGRAVVLPSSRHLTGGFTVEDAAAVTMRFFVLALRPPELSRRGPEKVTKMTG